MEQQTWESFAVFGSLLETRWFLGLTDPAQKAPSLLFSSFGSRRDSSWGETKREHDEVSSRDFAGYCFLSLSSRISQIIYWVKNLLKFDEFSCETNAKKNNKKQMRKEKKNAFFKSDSNCLRRIPGKKNMWKFNLISFSGNFHFNLLKFLFVYFLHTFFFFVNLMPKGFFWKILWKIHFHNFHIF